MARDTPCRYSYYMAVIAVYLRQYLSGLGYFVPFLDAALGDTSWIERQYLVALYDVQDLANNDFNKRTCYEWMYMLMVSRF